VRLSEWIAARTDARPCFGVNAVDAVQEEAGLCDWMTRRQIRAWNADVSSLMATVLRPQAALRAMSAFGPIAFSAILRCAQDRASRESTEARAVSIDHSGPLLGLAAMALLLSLSTRRAVARSRDQMAILRKKLK
jgi:hypothetical protein